MSNPQKSSNQSNATAIIILVVILAVGVPCLISAALLVGGLVLFSYQKPVPQQLVAPQPLEVPIPSAPAPNPPKP